MATVITDEQRILIRKNPRFDEMTKAAVANFATYIHDQDGTNLPPGMSHKQWALQRFFIAEPIVNHPSQQDINGWASQFIMLLKGADVWMDDPDPLPVGTNPGDATIDEMITTNKFEAMANLAFALRGENVKF